MRFPYSPTKGLSSQLDAEEKGPRTRGGNPADQEKHRSLKISSLGFRIQSVVILILVARLNAKLVKHIGIDPEKNLEANLDAIEQPPAPPPTDCHTSKYK